MNNGIIILDFGSQYNQLIGRRIREMEVYSEILPFNTSLEEIKSKNPAGIILSVVTVPLLTMTPPPLS